MILWDWLLRFFGGARVVITPDPDATYTPPAIDPYTVPAYDATYTPPAVEAYTVPVYDAVYRPPATEPFGVD